MDMSKLPRLSQSPQPPPEGAPQPGTPADPTTNYRPADLPATTIAPGPEIWISLAIGLILMLVGRQFGTYLISRITHEAFHTGVTWTSGPNAGQEVGYWDLAGYTAWTDASLWLFGLTLVVDAMILYLAGGKRLWLVATGFALTVGVCAFNAFVCAKLFNNGVTPLMSLMALAFGIYTAIYQWGLLKDLLAARGFSPALR